MSENEIQQPSSVDELPEWAQKEIRDARSEAQNLRQRHNAEIEKIKTDHAAELDALKATVNLTDERAALAELTLSNTALAVERGLPLNVVPMIVGDDEEARIASADALAALRTPPEQDPSARQTDPAQEAEPTVDPRQAIADAFFGNS